MKTGILKDSKMVTKVSKCKDDQYLSNVLCLMFNGTASIVSIIFLVLFITGKTGALLWLGLGGCVCITLANTTDLFPFWLKKLWGK
jgi:hypothetical protein